jgi:magnesium transporter
MTPSSRSPDRPVAALIAPDILALLDESPQDVAVETEEMHPADLANIAELMPPGRVSEFLRVLPEARAAAVLEYLDEELRAELLEAMSPEQAAQLVGAMTPDERADVLEELEEETADEILSDMPTAARQETERLLQFEPDTAGGLMTTQFVAVPQGLTIEEALAKVRVAARSGQREAMHAIYVTDDDGLLLGVMSLRELVGAPDGARVADVMTTEIVKVATNA